MTDNEKLIVDLPDLEQVFEALRRGRHICMPDGRLYTALKSRAEDFKALFAQLGFELAHHPRDFFYFVDRTNFTDLSARMAVFMFVLVEDMADKGDPVEETLMSRHFRYSDLPHLTGQRYRQLMREAGMTEPGHIEHLLQAMERFGFIERLADDSFAFRAPAYRFLDLCMELASTAGESDTDKEDKQEDDQ
jgi:hypothetical protein